MLFYCRSAQKSKLFSRLIFLFLTISLLQACHSFDSTLTEAPVLNDHAFTPYPAVNIETPEEIFAIDESIIDFVNTATAQGRTDKEKLANLIFAIFDRDELSLNYSAGANTTATETFHKGNANCLSLTILTYAMMQHMGFESEFQNVRIPEFWTRRDGRSFINLHINLLVKVKRSKYSSMPNDALVIDFDPQQQLQNFKVNTLKKSRITSNFYINKAADYIITEQKDKAYAYLKAAINRDAKNAGAWMNLGVLFAQQGSYKEAEQYYQHAIMLEPDYSAAYQNLALLHKRTGKEAQAIATLNRLHKKRLINPYYHMMKGDVAAEELRFTDAVKHYKKAISISSQPHSFHFALARTYYRMGNNKQAQLYLKKAKRRANNQNVVEQYATKISYLQSLASVASQQNKG